jgi:nucleoside recognition membrane protein YjiH
VKESASREWAEPVMTIGCVAAILWGVAISLRAFFLEPLAMDWTEWAVQFVGGIVVCLLLARIGLFVADWIGNRSRLAPALLEPAQAESPRP